MNVDDYTQPVEAVIAQERAFVFPVPLKAESYRELFNEWLRVNPKAAHEIESTALAIHRRGLRVSTKYLIERVRYESAYRLVACPTPTSTASRTTTASTTQLPRCLRGGCLKTTPTCA